MKKQNLVYVLSMVLSLFCLSEASAVSFILPPQTGNPQYQYTAEFLGQPVVVVAVDDDGAGVRIQLMSNNSKDGAFAKAAVAAVSAKLGSYRVNQSDYKSTLVTTGKRSKPTPEDLKKLLTEVAEIIKPVADQHSMNIAQSYAMPRL